jgi:23S rRNA (pseudouridine1915-N3)-methyltransferase
MKISLLCMGKTTFGYLKEGIELYEEIINRYSSFQIIEIPDKKKGSTKLKEVLKREGESILSKLDPADYLVLLDERGEQFTSEEFSGFISKILTQPFRRLVFGVGGVFGFSEEVYKRANAKISLSNMTFSHQMVRLLFMEQIYRAFTIMRGEPYHHA